MSRTRINTNKMTLNNNEGSALDNKSKTEEEIATTVTSS